MLPQAEFTPNAGDCVRLLLKGAAMNLLVTGGAGFIGSNFIRYWLEQYPDDRVVNLDVLTYAGNLSSLSDIATRYAGRYAFVRGDIGNSDLVEHVLALYRTDTVVNFAA